jgi:hypothetical protein
VFRIELQTPFKKLKPKIYGLLRSKIEIKQIHRYKYSTRETERLEELESVLHFHFKPLLGRTGH